MHAGFAIVPSCRMFRRFMRAPTKHLTLGLAAICAAPLFSATPASDFQQNIQPVLKEHCFKCHNEEKKKGRD